jgi:hypothetical protein
MPFGVPALVALAALSVASGEADSVPPVTAQVPTDERPENPVLTSPPVRNGRAVDATLVGATGLAGTVTSGRGGDATSHVASVSLRSRRLGYAYDQGLIVRVYNSLELGGGAHGFRGGIQFAVSGGYRVRVGDTHGPFVRAGVDARTEGDPLLYQSLLELPQVHVGYQLVDGAMLLEVAGRAGLSLFGQSNTGHAATRPLDRVLDAGGMVTARVGPVLVTGGWSHLVASAPGGPVDWVDGSVCASARKVALCTDARLVVGDVRVASGAALSTTVATGVVARQVGLVVGFGGK